RFVRGNLRLLGARGPRWGRFKEAEAPGVCGSGSLANLVIIPALIGPGGLVLIDELAHACLWAGARPARAAVVPFRHADARHVDALLTELRQRHPPAFVATGGVFSLGRSIPPFRPPAPIPPRDRALLR